MQERHKNRAIYFKELSITSKNYFIPYIQHWHSVETGTDVLEIGCGDGGNLLPFSEMGCRVVGVDIAACRVKDARIFFADAPCKRDILRTRYFSTKGIGTEF